MGRDGAVSSSTAGMRLDWNSSRNRVRSCRALVPLIPLTPVAFDGDFAAISFLGQLVYESSSGSTVHLCADSIGSSLEGGGVAFELRRASHDSLDGASEGTSRRLRCSYFFGFLRQLQIRVGSELLSAAFLPNFTVFFVPSTQQRSLLLGDDQIGRRTKEERRRRASKRTRTKRKKKFRRS